MNLALDQLRGDRRTKQVVVYSLCGIAGAFAATVCTLALRQLPIPDALDRLVTYVVGVMSGMLVKTGVDQARNSEEPIPVTAPKPLPVENVSDEPMPDGGDGDASEADESRFAVARPERRDPLSKTVQTK